MTNTLTITGLKTPYTYLVDSVTDKEKSEYIVNTHKKSCTCPYGTHKPETLISQPCKHLQFCLSSEFESITKNFVHFQLFKKGLVVVKVTKLTPIFKAGKKTKIVAASYILNDGSKRCCFVNISQVSSSGERFFEVYESTKDQYGNRVLKVGVTGKLVHSVSFGFGSQFDLVFKDGFYVKRTYGEIGCYLGHRSTSIYEAMTSFLLPESIPQFRDYMSYLRCQCNGTKYEGKYGQYFEHNAISLVAMRQTDKSMLNPYPLVSVTFENENQIKEFKQSQKDA